VDTDAAPDADELHRLIAESRLDDAPPHQPAPDRFVYRIDVDGQVTTLGEGQLSPPQQALVRRVLEADSPEN
jgi:hypothetical protein